MTEKEFIELVKSRLSVNSKMVKIEKDGYTYYEVGKLNINKTAMLIKDLI